MPKWGELAQPWQLAHVGDAPDAKAPQGGADWQVLHVV